MYTPEVREEWQIEHVKLHAFFYLQQLLGEGCGIYGFLVSSHFDNYCNYILKAIIDSGDGDIDDVVRWYKRVEREIREDIALLIIKEYYLKALQ